MLSARYRDALIYSEETFATSKAELARVTNALKQVEVNSQIKNISLTEDYDKQQYQLFLDAMSDDLNTPNAYMIIFDTIKLLNKALRVREVDWNQVSSYYNSIRKMLNVLGIDVKPVVLTDQEKELFEKYNSAKAVKDFQLADQYRQQLIDKNLM